MSQKHTPEPWEVGMSGLSFTNGKIVLGRVNYSHLIDEGEPKANAQRIVSCVNAMHGIENPSEWVKTVKEVNWDMIKRGLHALEQEKYIRALVKADENESTFDEVARMKSRFISMLKEVQKEYPRMKNIGKLIAEYE